MRFSKNKHLNTRAIAFIEKYSSLKKTSLSLDEYNQKYLEKYLEKIEYNTYLACQLIEGVKPKNYTGIIDLGGGIGFNAAFFSFIGFNNVLYFDVDELSTRDAKVINRAIGIDTIDYYSTGFEELKKIDLSDYIISSRDVIEHIYNLPSFFEITKHAKLNRHNTAAVFRSVFRESEFKEIHHTAEFVGKTTEISKKRDSQSAYFELRKEIIKLDYPQKTENELQELTEKTRGLAGKDIEQYLDSNSLPLFHHKILHTNTCDPITGNWAERTLSFSDYKLLAQSMPIKFRLVKYNAFDGNILKRVALKTLNLVLRITKSERLCPSFTLEF